MANPSPTAISAIRAHVTDWTPDNATIAAALNAPAVANPVPQPIIPKPFASADLANACSAANRPGLGIHLAGSAAALIVGQQRDYLKLGLDALAAIGTISTADATAMKAVIDTTIPDPSWQPLVGWARANLGRDVDTDDIAAARP